MLIHNHVALPGFDIGECAFMSGTSYLAGNIKIHLLHLAEALHASQPSKVVDFGVSSKKGVGLFGQLPF